MTIAFYIAAAVAIVSTLMAVTRSNAVHALLYLIVSFMSVALIFLLLGAPFVAALEVIIYAGAIMVLFVFVVMMLNIGPPNRNAPGQAGPDSQERQRLTGAGSQERRWLTGAGWVGPAVLTAVLLAEFLYVVTTGDHSSVQVMEVTPKRVATSLLGPYLVGVELVSLLLLLGLVGAFHLARRPGGGRQSKVRGEET